MKQKVILVLCGLYLLFMGPMLDPLPFIDEGVALALFIKTLKDMISERSLRRKGEAAAAEGGDEAGKGAGEGTGPIIDVD